MYQLGNGIIESHAMNEIKLTYKTRRQIADELGLSYATLRRRIRSKKIPISKGKLLTPEEQRLIYATLYWPPAVDRATYEALEQ